MTISNIADVAITDINGYSKVFLYDNKAQCWRDSSGDIIYFTDAEKDRATLYKSDSWKLAEVKESTAVKFVSKLAGIYGLRVGA